MNQSKDAIVARYNCVLFGKLSYFIRTLLLVQGHSHSFWGALSNDEFVLICSTVTSVFISSNTLGLIIVLSCLIIKWLNFTCFQSTFDSNISKLHSKYVKFLFDLKDIDLVTKNDCLKLLDKIKESLRKINYFKSIKSGIKSSSTFEPSTTNRCVICLDDKRTMCVLKPCCHIVLCYDCAVTIRELTLLCPCCRLPCYSCIPLNQTHKQ